MPASPKIEKVAAPDVDKLRAMAAAVVQAAGTPARPAGYRPRFLPSPPLVVTPAAAAPPVIVAPAPVVAAPAPVVMAPEVTAPPVVAAEPAVRKALSLSRRTVGIAAVGAGAAIVTVLALSGRSETSLPRAPVMASVRMPQELPPVAPQPPKAAPAPAPAPVPTSDPGKPKLDQGQDQGGKTLATAAPVRSRAAARAARKRAGAGPRTVAAAAPEKAKPAADEPGGVSDGTNSELDQLVKKALDGKEKRGETRAEEPVAQPGLTRNDIMASMKPLRPRIKECYRQFGEKGMALVQVQVGDKGQVASAKVAGTFAGTPTGSCVEAAVKSVRFPQSAGMNFQYPFPVR
jgi:hypothetical protein